MARGVISHLTNLTQQIEWGKREGQERDFRERRSTFSLDFPLIGPANFGKARSKVGLHYKSYTWVPVLGEFRQTLGGRVLLLLGLVLA